MWSEFNSRHCIVHQPQKSLFEFIINLYIGPRMQSKYWKLLKIRFEENIAHPLKYHICQMYVLFLWCDPPEFVHKKDIGAIHCVSLCWNDTKPLDIIYMMLCAFRIGNLPSKTNQVQFDVMLVMHIFRLNFYNSNILAQIFHVPTIYVSPEKENDFMALSNFGLITTKTTTTTESTRSTSSSCKICRNISMAVSCSPICLACSARE